MTFFKTLRSKAISLGVVGAMAVTLVTPVVASAAYAPVPSAGKTADYAIATVGAHRAAETGPLMLGNELTTMQTSATTEDAVKASPVFKVFGSDWNETPSVYLWNYFYNTGHTPTVTPAVTRLTATVPPMSADSSGVTYTTYPDIYLGIAAHNNYTYPDTAAKGVAYNCNDLNDLISTMYALAQKSNAVKNSTSSGRYGNPIDIAKDYEKYIKATKYYVLSQLGTSEMKKVAIVGPGTTSGNYKLYTTDDSSGTAYTCRAAEYLDGTTINVAEELAEDETVDLDNVTLNQLNSTEVEYIFTVGIQGTQATINGSTDATVISTLPTTIYGIVMNSAENALGVGLFQSVVYPEYFDVDSVRNNGNDINGAIAYFYRNFYHLKLAYIGTVAEDFEAADFPVDISSANASTYVSSYASKLNDGMTYYTNHLVDFADTPLEMSEEYYN